jgi:predicted enzyme related to lactoylglutathione lyase
MKKRVTGIGGVFFKGNSSDQSKAWYEKHLGIPNEEYGHTFMWKDFTNPNLVGRTVWYVADDYFEKDNKQTFMINYRVENLEELLKTLKNEGVKIVGELKEYPYGKFAHILDLDGNKVELWEPVAEEEMNKITNF